MISDPRKRRMMMLMMGSDGGGLSRLIGNGRLSSLMSFSRAQASGAVATGLDMDGTTRDTYAADVPRFVSPANGLLIEGQRTNSLPNPRAEGATGATPPTGWSISNTRGLTHTWTLTTVDGIPGVLWNITGVATGTGQLPLNLEPVVADTAGINCSVSSYVKLQAGSLAGLSTFVTLVGTETAVGFTPSATMQRPTFAANVAGTDYRAKLRLNVVDLVTTVNCTLFIGWPQREMSAIFPSSAILPVAGTPAASTRGADLATTPFTSTSGTVLAEVMIPQNAPSGVDQMIFQLDDGTDNNRIRLRNVAAGATLVAGSVVSGSSTDATSAGSMTAGTRFKIALAFDAAGVTVLLSGGTAQTITAVPSGLTTLRVGNSVAGTAGLFGDISKLLTLPSALSAAQMQAELNNL